MRARKVSGNKFICIHICHLRFDIFVQSNQMTLVSRVVPDTPPKSESESEFKPEYDQLNHAMLCYNTSPLLSWIKSDIHTYYTKQ